jgi:hypothetical protein
MRWKEIRKPWPRFGQKRYREGFLALPKLIGDEWRWLETARWQETYSSYVPGRASHGRWVAVSWADPEPNGYAS